jgi:ABC-type oligopeptide transport system ATPase subunit
MTEPILQIRSLTKHFPQATEHHFWRRARQSWLHAVDNVDFSIGPGETVGLVGESGCGKSTPVRLVAHLIDPSGGGIGFDGTEIGGIPARKSPIRYAGSAGGAAQSSRRECTRRQVWPDFPTNCSADSRINYLAVRRRGSALPALWRSSRGC